MSEPTPQYGGMTVNERLSHAGLRRAFDVAIASGDRAAAIAVLDRVALEDQSASIVDSVFRDPRKYGYAPPASG